MCGSSRKVAAARRRAARAGTEKARRQARLVSCICAQTVRGRSRWQGRRLRFHPKAAGVSVAVSFFTFPGRNQQLACAFLVRPFWPEPPSRRFRYGGGSHPRRGFGTRSYFTPFQTVNVTGFPRPGRVYSTAHCLTYRCCRLMRMARLMVQPSKRKGNDQMTQAAASSASQITPSPRCREASCRRGGFPRVARRSTAPAS